SPTRAQDGGKPHRPELEAVGPLVVLAESLPEHLRDAVQRRRLLIVLVRRGIRCSWAEGRDGTREDETLRVEQAGPFDSMEESVDVHVIGFRGTRDCTRGE